MSGRREQKKQATHARIAAEGLRLFRERGYDGTTIDEIAVAAGISRRTFFSYFGSKDEVLLAWHGAGALADALAPPRCSVDPPPPTRCGRRRSA